MWLIFKIKENKRNFFKSSILSKIGKKIIFFVPKYKKITFNKNRYFKKVKELLPGHIFVYCENVENIIIDKLKYLEGLKFFYQNYLNNQKDILNFISECKKFEDEKGFIRENYFLKLKKDKGVFSSGPLANLFFTIQSQNKNNFELKIENKKMIINKSNFINYHLV